MRGIVVGIEAEIKTENKEERWEMVGIMVKEVRLGRELWRIG